MVTRRQCKDCGSTSIKRSDKSLGGRLICEKCSSFRIGFTERRGASSIFYGYKELYSGISPYDWQFIIPVLFIIFVYLSTDLFGFLNKGYLIYWSGLLIDQPHRIFTSNFAHADLNHLLLNIGGIVVARNFLNLLGLSRRGFFLEFICLCIFLSACLAWSFDILLIGNPNSRMLGFSGIIYAIYAFILLASCYSKKSFLGSDIDLRSSYKVKKSMQILTLIGIIWSFFPGVSLLGHLAGFLSGCLLFLI